MLQLEHPDITAAQVSGYPKPEAERPTCPICGAETYDVYYSGETDRCVGCPRCVSLLDIYEL